MATAIHTYFAPAERAGDDEIASLSLALAAELPVQKVLDSVPEALLILNRHRQIVFANRQAVEVLGREMGEVLGLRPGEALGCTHANEVSGCGTSKSCRYCGTVRGILDSQRDGGPAVQDCRILRDGGPDFSALDVRVWATPICVAGENLVILVLRDTTDERRREVLEQLFFHDVLNAAGGLREILDVWMDLPAEDLPAMRQAALYLVDQVVDEIQAQRDLAAAESGDLRAETAEFDAGPFLEKLCAFYGRGVAGAGRKVAPPEISGSTVLLTDPVLLRRVIGNLVKNALEATPRGGTVRVSFENEAVPVLRVHNEGMMPESVQMQLFQRSFSTKASHGRGIGTYSVKLLTERYLGGSVSFTSSKSQGTIFIVTLPPGACEAKAA